MLFNSYEFIFFFLPVVLVFFHRLGFRRDGEYAMAWLVLASLFFYAWWRPVYLWLILASMLFNYAVGKHLDTTGGHRREYRRLILVVGVAANLALLGYFKYAVFIVDNLNQITGSSYSAGTIVLPLAISFFTFQQIAYLVDVYQDKAEEHSFLHYCLFVTFFPQLIAGPIVHHSEILPQFAVRNTFRLNSENIAVGLTIFVIGLFKKVVLADGLSIYANPVFDAAAQGVTPTFAEGWFGALAYSFQLYFDFSGYADMAIGLGRMFGVRLPANFDSPYKARNLAEFWRCWHMTLSRFLRDYLYIPLGGNRRGRARRYLNLMLTMLLGGLWHGAGWTFVVWGGLHGAFLALNHAWQGYWKDRRGIGPFWLRAFSARLLTFLLLVVAWVFFRAESFDGAVRILDGMVSIGTFLNMGAVSGEAAWFAHGLIENPARCGALLAALLAAVWYLPNTQEITRRYTPVLLTYGDSMRVYSGWLAFEVTAGWAFLTASLAIYAIIGLSRAQEFLYFNF
jgi:D-alanyl-lipoteichoic acid acyltransferase DltB (MBOAT superfamily)